MQRSIISLLLSWSHWSWWLQKQQQKARERKLWASGTHLNNGKNNKRMQKRNMIQSNLPHKNKAKVTMSIQLNGLQRDTNPLCEHSPQTGLCQSWWSKWIFVHQRRASCSRLATQRSFWWCGWSNASFSIKWLGQRWCGNIGSRKWVASVQEMNTITAQTALWLLKTDVVFILCSMHVCWMLTDLVFKVAMDIVMSFFLNKLTANSGCVSCEMPTSWIRLWAVSWRMLVRWDNFRVSLNKLEKVDMSRIHPSACIQLCMSMQQPCQMQHQNKKCWSSLKRGAGVSSSSDKHQC